MASEEWTNAAHVDRYLQRADEYPRRAEGEGVLSTTCHAMPVASSTSGPATAGCSPAARSAPRMLGVGLDFSG